MYTTDNISNVLPIKHLLNKAGEPTTTHKLATGTKPLLSDLSVLLCACVIKNGTSHNDKKALNMRH